MTSPTPAPTTEADSRQILKFLDQIESDLTGRDDRWTNKRSFARKAVRAPCSIRYLSPDGVNVLSASGWTRDLSLSGIGFLTATHLPRRSHVQLTITLPGSRPRTVAGVVVFSRLLGAGWYLTGMQFDMSSQEQFAVKKAEAAKTEVVSEENGAEGAAGDVARLAAEVTGAGGDDNGKTKGSGQQRALRLLATVANLGAKSRELIDTVVLLSSSSDHEIRRACVPACMRIPMKDGVPVLISMLQDASVAIQGDAADALGQMNNSSAIGPLKELLKHKNPQVALRAAGALGRLGDRSGLRLAKEFLDGQAEHTPLAAMIVGRIMGHNFRPNSEGVESARRYLDAKGV